MKPRNNSRFQPIVTAEQAAAYDPQKPETRTASRIVNDVVEAIGHVCPAQLAKVARYLGVEPIAVSGALLYDTGMRYQDFIDQWRKHMIIKLYDEEPKLAGDHLARRIGFLGRTPLWLFMDRMKLLKYSRKAQATARSTEKWDKLFKEIHKKGLKNILEEMENMDELN